MKYRDFIMKRILILIFLGFIFSQSYGCKLNWDTTCKKNEDCCSNHCYEESHWQFGVCKPEDINYPPKFNKCADDYDNHCVVNEHCCSGLCDKSADQKFGVCRPNECEPLVSEKLVIECFTFSNKTTSCETPLESKSRATFRCNTPVYQRVKDPEYTEIFCRFGKWDRLLVDDFCQAQCGRAVSDVEGPPIAKNKSTFRDFPWHVGIYKYYPSTMEYKQIAGGTLISSKVVITAAHTFTSHPYNVELNIPKFEDLSKYKIAVGKHYRNLSAPEDSFAQIRDIASVEVSSEYKDTMSNYMGDIAFVVLSEKIKYSLAVLPICIDIGENNFEKDQLKEGAVGMIAGWRPPNENLILAQMPFVPKNACRKKNLKTWDVQIYLQNDKFCAGNTENYPELCAGAGGEGLVFLEPTEEKYYLRGIWSLGPSCSNPGINLFTKLSSYKELVLRYLKPQFIL